MNVERLDLSSLNALVTGPLVAGVGPAVAVKDCIDVAGVPSRLGSRAFEEVDPAARHAEVVSRLVDAGCAIVGKANMHELAYGVTGINEWTGTPSNIRFPKYVPGGSSSGSAVAVAAGLADFAIGTDTGGSIRVPAACCGVAGLKPSFGLVSRTGVQPAYSTLDCVGPLAPSMCGIIQAMEIIGPDFAVRAPMTNFRLGRVRTSVDARTEQALGRVLTGLGLKCADVHLPSFENAFDAALVVIGREMAGQLGHLCSSELLGEDVRRRLRAARKFTADDAARADDVRARFSHEVDHALLDVDALVLPTLPSAPVRRDRSGDPRATLRMTSLVRPFNLSGHPALSLPLPGDGGAPMSLQIVGRRGADAQLCEIGLALEALVDG